MNKINLSQHLFNYALVAALIISQTYSVFSQETTCKVLVPAISDIYKGECKKGFAHGQGLAEGIDTYKGNFKKGYPSGKGKYTWENGSYYEGYWKKGKKEGLGKFVFFINDQDSTLEGYWKGDRYIGENRREINYRVFDKRNIDRVSFMKKLDEGNTIYVIITRMGTRMGVNNLRLLYDSGNDIYLGSIFGYENVEFPFKGSIKFSAPNKLNTQIYEYILEFEIVKPGTWDVNIII